MAHLAVYGIGEGLDGRSAAMQGTQKALDQLGVLRPALAIAFVAEEFEVADALTGLSALLGDTPLWGLSTTRPLAGDLERPRAVVVVLVAGSDLKAQSHWWPGFSADSQETARQVVRTLRSDLVLPQAIMLTADGVNGDLTPLCAGLADLPAQIGGCLASGGYRGGKTGLFARTQAGFGGLATLALGGRFRLSTATGHGWRDTGLQVRFSRAAGNLVQSIDGAPAVDFYARTFGRTPREWAYPPLNELARLYPFGIPTYPGSPELHLHAPLRIEADGSLRMNAPVPVDVPAQLMLGDPAACLQAVEQAALQAVRGLESAHALIGMLFVDVAWQQLFGIHSGDIAQAAQEALGSIPVVGAYTLGQVARPGPGAAPRLFDQGIQVALLGYQEK